MNAKTIKEPKPQKVGFELTDDSYMKIALNFAQSRGKKPFSKKEMETIFDWVKKISIDSYLLQFVLDFSVLIDVKDGEITFRGLGEKTKGSEEVEKEE